MANNFPRLLGRHHTLFTSAWTIVGGTTFNSRPLAGWECPDRRSSSLAFINESSTSRNRAVPTTQARSPLIRRALEAFWQSVTSSGPRQGGLFEQQPDGVAGQPVDKRKRLQGARVARRVGPGPGLHGLGLQKRGDSTPSLLPSAATRQRSPSTEVSHGCYKMVLVMRKDGTF